MSNSPARNLQDAYLSIPALVEYSGLCERTLRALLASPSNPLPHFKVGRKILIRKSEFDRWMEGNHRAGRNLEKVVDEIMASVKECVTNS